ncbi:MAG: DUF1848 domain-containing protein [Erysipelotrichales bacterium]|nr:DUF1848 domain-containing protein [Erysipelotrichales bacterium]
MILHTGNRTDIPAFYAEWFKNRLEEGYVMSRSPYDPSLVMKYTLDPSVVDLIVFCTNNPEPMMKYAEYLKPYGQYWYVTVTPYGKDMEPNVPDKHRIIEVTKEIGKRLGKQCAGWRYDPIIINDRYTAEYHKRAFRTIAEELDGYVSTCVFSFVDLYEKVKRNAPEIREVDWDTRIELGKEIIQIAKEHHMTVRPCNEGDVWKEYGADCDGCMTEKMFCEAAGVPVKVPKSRYHRDGCACYLGSDIGMYDTCGHFCRYCYANSNRAAVIQNRKLHDPESPLLIGNVTEQDRIIEAKQTSWKTYSQQKLTEIF